MLNLRKLSPGMLLIIAGIGVLGLSYPATVACCYLGLQFTVVLYTTVIVATLLIFWGMIRIFG